jgi:hypothetical protein
VPAFIALGIGLPAAATHLSTLAEHAHRPLPIRATAVHGGHELAGDPLLLPGAEVSVTARGFDPGEQVAVRRDTIPEQSMDLVADDSGSARFSFTVSRRGPASDVISFQGQAESPRGTIDATSDGLSSGGNLTLHVPHFSIFPFRVHR